MALDMPRGWMKTCTYILHHCQRPSSRSIPAGRRSACSGSRPRSAADEHSHAGHQSASSGVPGTAAEPAEHDSHLTPCGMAHSTSLWKRGKRAALTRWQTRYQQQGTPRRAYVKAWLLCSIRCACSLPGDSSPWNTWVRRRWAPRHPCLGRQRMATPVVPRPTCKMICRQAITTASYAQRQAPENT